jgi:hypothetical protein
MAKCALIDCNERAIGGFQELVDIATITNPGATIPSLITCWCAAHQEMLEEEVFGKRGVWLKPGDL